MEEELVKLRKVVEEMKEKIECTICMEIPMKCPVPVCSNGHFICSQCLDRREEDGHRNCATCKVPMGNSKSLLATVVVENIEHKCNFEDCEEMVHFKEYKNHQRLCENRNVNCPGAACNKLLSFREVVAHAKICPKIDTETGPLFDFDVPDRFLGIENFSRNTCIIIQNSKNFFLKARKIDNHYALEAVILGSPEECEDYRAEISILDSKHHPVLSSSFPPSPIGLEPQGNKCLVVSQEVLASIWKYEEEEKINRFKVAVNIYSNSEVGQGKAKKPRVQEKESDDDDTKDDEQQSDVNNDDDSDEEDIC